MAHDKLYGICENKCFVQLKNKDFTYIVNNDASLEYWLTNKASGTSSGGEDFTSVLIKKGTWNFNGTTTLLSTIGTLYVEGETGSKLVFTDTSHCLRYGGANVETSMYNVTIESTRAMGTSCFYRCANLINCKAITNCVGTGNNVTARGFYGCTNLTNCIGVGISTSTGTSFINGRGFDECSNLNNCTGTGTGDNNGYGFFNCKVVHNCKAGGHCTTNVFIGSYASHAENETYVCADTANGGFNDTTNPSA